MFSLIFLERDRNIDVRKKHPSAQPPLGIKLTTQNIHHIALDTPIGFNIQSSSTSTFSYGIGKYFIASPVINCVCLFSLVCKKECLNNGSISKIALLGLIECWLSVLNLLRISFI
uniref:Uncharacterized protein n=1 Tax=Molossus molossus TaxID=27622 RepID=A0A7J8C8R6_MOLMO|nr:hypothetical protein HJG59_009914 [Molossus molossus]